MIKNLSAFNVLGTLCLLLCSFDTFAQAITDTLTEAKSASFKIGISYINNDVFNGRGDSVKTPTIIPALKYTFKSGLYFAAELYDVTNRKTNKLDGGNIEAGYDFDITDDLEGGISFSKLFYNANSTQVNSSIRGIFNAYLDYDIADIITPLISLNYDFNRQGVNNDTFLKLGLSHDFTFNNVFGPKDALTLSPSAELNSGTQNFYDDYALRRQARNKKLAAVQSAVLAKDKAELAKFSLLDYEFALPFEYQTGHVIIKFIPTYALIQNQLPANIAQGLPTNATVFYFETGIALKF